MGKVECRVDGSLNKLLWASLVNVVIDDNNDGNNDVGDDYGKKY